jgi:major vault protein
VENYVKFLTDHLRSFIRNIVKRYPIMEFYANGINILRDAILGQPNEEGKRAGRAFVENGMRIYDVEVLDLRLTDTAIENLLISSQQEVVKQTLRIAGEKRKLEFTQESEHISRQIAQTQSETTQNKLDLKIQEIQKQLEVQMAEIKADLSADELRLQAKLAEQESLTTIQEAELSRQQRASDLEIAIAQRKLEQQLLKIKSEVEAVVAKAEAVSPNLVAALQAFGDKALAEKMAESMSPLAILGGKSIAEVFANLLKGTNLGQVIAQSKLGSGLNSES